MTRLHDRPLVLTGMHRSGTSLVARLFRASGVDLGAELLRADAHNPEGYFEDPRFLAFHGRVLEARDPGRRALWCPPDRLGWTPRDREEAARLVALRRTEGAWGWKDPRTVLFLEEWHDLVPEARFVLVFRHPEQVVDSLRRRRDRRLLLRALGRSLSPSGRRRGLFRYGRAIEAWRRYNERLLRFANAHSERCLVADLEAVVREPTAALDRARERFGLPLGPVAWGDVYDAGLLTREPHPRVRARLARRADVHELLERLRKRADLG